MFFWILLAATFFLAYSNGANDNFKGVATLFGSKTTNYKIAIWWATITTFAGSMFSIYLAETLISNFSGKGLVPNTIIASPNFLLAVAISAGLTVMLATFSGFPISTTHGLTGALIGGGIVAVGGQVNFFKLGTVFLLPLLLSPFIAVAISTGAYLLANKIRSKLGITKYWCVCVNETEIAIPAHRFESTLALDRISIPAGISMDTEQNCSLKYEGNILGINIQKVMNAAHFISAGSMSFARGLNDTPKIVALLLVVKAFEIKWGIIGVAIGMAVGGLLNAKKVAITMSRKITPMTPGQGFTANLVTSFLVIFASRMGVPVSSTHVSCGSLFGIGLLTKQANIKIITEIVLSWILTLPIAAVLSGIIFWLFGLL